MSRSERLLDLLQALRRRRLAVSARTLAQELGVHVRTIYRDIDTLRAQGASIEGEAGVGYVLRPGFTLPPLSFTREEVEVLVLGIRWTSRQGDPGLALAARNALSKIGAVLSPTLRDEISEVSLLVGGPRPSVANPAWPETIRKAIREERKVDLEYRSEDGSITQRVIWPFCLGFFDQVQVVAAWCEARQDFRHFRLDRIVQARISSEAIPEPRRLLLARWQETQGIPPDAFEIL